MKSLLSVALVALSFCSLAALAKDPPPLPKNAKPPVWDRRGAPEQNRGEAIFDGPIREYPAAWWTSGVKLPMFKTHKRDNKSFSNAAGLTGSPSVIRKSAPRIVANDVPSFTNFLYTSNASNDQTFDNQSDVEPSLITTVTSTFVTSTAVSQTHSLPHAVGPPFVPHSHWRAQAEASSTPTHTPFSTPYLFPLGSGFNESGDSTVAANPYGSGIRPGAVYASFFSGYRPEPTSSNPNTTMGNPMNIVVWGSDDGGISWNNTSVAAQTLASDVYSLDKPVMDVSWFPGNGAAASTLGYIYVAWIEDTHSLANRIVLRRNTGGLWTRCRPAGGGCITAWDAPVPIVDGSTNEGASDPQVVVNHDNGDIYVFWFNAYGEIRFRRSTNGGANFNPPVTALQGINVIYGQNSDGFIPNGLRAIVVPTIKYDTANHKVVAVWHSRTAPDPTNETAIYYASFDASTIMSPVGFVTVVDPPGTQMQPAIDNDTAGRLVITYYTTQNNTFGSTYEPYAICVNTAGTPISGCGPSVFTTVPAEFTGFPLTGVQQPNSFIGDYHENFFWTFADYLGARWNTSWTAASRNNRGYEILVTGVK